MDTSLEFSDSNRDQECETVADRRRNEAKHSRAVEALPLRQTICVTDLIAGHLRDLRESGNLTAKTTSSYESYARKWVEPRIGGLLVDRVRLSDIDSVAAAMVQAHRSASSVNHVKALLRGSFERARRLGLIDVSPMAAVQKSGATVGGAAAWISRRPGETGWIRCGPLTAGGAQAIDETILARLLEASTNHPMTNLALRLSVVLPGSRRELVALQWSAIDLEARAVQTFGSQRAIRLDPTTSTLLEGAHHRRYDDGKWVVSSDGGRTPWTVGHLSNRFALVRDKVPEAHAIRLGDLSRSVRAAQTTAAQTTAAQTTAAQTTPAHTTPAQTTPAQTTPAQTTRTETRIEPPRTQTPLPPDSTYPSGRDRSSLPYPSDLHASDLHANDLHANDKHANDKHANDKHANDKHANDKHANDTLTCPACNRPLDASPMHARSVSMQPSAVELRRHLTPGEDAVAVLAAQGLSNNTIAERQFVSVKAVEFHLTHVFQKLGILNRTQLSLLFGAGPFDPNR